MNVIQYIKFLLAQGQLQPAIDTLNKIAQGTYYENDALGVSFSFHSFMKSAATMDESAQQREKNRLSKSITYIADQLANVLPSEIMNKEYEMPSSSTSPSSSPEKPPITSQKELRKILFMSANPAETTALKLPDEMRDIKNTLKSSRDRDDFDFILEPQVNASIIRQRIKEEQPEIVHFSGHGGLDAGFTEGIVVNGSGGNSIVLTGNALGRLFEMAKEYVKCVVLNSCYSDTQAQAIKAHIPHVIGMSDAIDNASARMFSVGFYEALGLGESYTEAFNSGTLAIEMEGLPGADIPVLL